MSNALTAWLDDSHASLYSGLEDAIRQWQPPTTTGDARAATDRFVITTARHIAAVAEGLAPVADDNAYRDAYVQSARNMERLLGVARARAYGQGQAVRVHWADLWPEIQTELDTMFALEHRMASTVNEASVVLVRDALHAQVVSGPTRAHPHLSHSRGSGRALRRLFGRTDRLWDELQGRTAREKVPSDGTSSKGRHGGWNWRLNI